MTGDYNLSATASDLLASRSPHDMAALYWSVKANEQLASVAFGRFEQLEPDSERTHLLLGDMYRQRQRYEQAESEYKMASALAPQDPAPLFGLASAYFQGSNTDQAFSSAKTALGMSPNDPDLNLLVGEILVSRREWAQAEDYLKSGAQRREAPDAAAFARSAGQGLRAHGSDSGGHQRTPDGGRKRRGRIGVLPACADIQQHRQQGCGPGRLPALESARAEAARARSHRRAGLQRCHAERYSLSGCPGGSTMQCGFTTLMSLHS